MKLLPRRLLLPLPNLNRTKLTAILFAAFILATFTLPIHSAYARSQDNEGPVPRFETEPCETFPSIPAYENSIVCGYLVVLERHDRVEGAVIRLAVAILPATDSDDPVAPLVILHGGPGGSAVENMDYLFSDHPTRQDRAIILVDQRGSGLSEPTMDCPEIVAYWYGQSEDQQNEEESAEEALSAFEACRDRLRGEGVDLSAYSTEESAADIEDLRTVLAHDRINLYGVSYGADLAIAVMSIYPDGIRSVILDSAIPANQDYDLSERAALEEIFSACEKSTACNRAYPHLEMVFKQTIERLNDEPIALKSTFPESDEFVDWVMDGDEFSSLLSISLYDSSMLPTIPMVIHDATKDKYSFFELFSEMETSMNTGRPWGLLVSIECVPQIDYFTSNYVDARRFSSTEALDGDNAPHYAECQMWLEDDSPSAAEIKGEMDFRTVLPEIPTLVLAGRFDLLVTPDYGNWIAEQLPRAISVTVENSGHGAIASSNCVDRMMQSFLEEPRKELKLDCLGSISEINFVTPEEIIRLPLIEIGLGFSRRSAAVLFFVGGVSLAWVVLLLGSTRSIFSIGAVERRTNVLARRWENLHGRTKSKAIRPRFLFAGAVFAIMASLYVGITSETDSAYLFALGGYGLSCIILIPGAVVIQISRSTRRGRKKWLLVRRWERMYGRKVPLLIQLTPVSSVGSAILITFTFLSIALVSLIRLFDGEIAGIVGVPRSSWVIFLMLAGAVVLSALAVIGTALAWRRSFWSSPRRILQAITAISSVMVVEPLGLIFLRGFFY